MKLRNKFKRFWTLDVHGHEGFTLVELIVVIAILAILGGVAVPAYGGYVKKAERAGDEQLLAAVNQAFASACAMNGEDHYNRTNTTIKLGGTAGARTVEEDSLNANNNAAITASFNTFFAGTEGVFKTMELLTYSPLLGGFVEANSSYAVLLQYFTQEQLTALAGSTFMTADGLGTEGLLLKINDVTAFAAMVDNAALNGILGSDSFRLAAGEALGLDPSDVKFGEKLEAKYQSLIAEMVEKNPGMTTEQAKKQLDANAAVLYASKNATNADITNVDEVRAKLISGGMKAEIQSNMNNNNTGLAMSQATLAYGMYTAYAYSTGDPDLIKKTENPLHILNGLEDPEFKAYMESPEGEADLDGYLAGLQMVNSSTQNEDAVSDLMVNGFSDPDLAALLNQSMGK